MRSPRSATCSKRATQEDLLGRPHGLGGRALRRAAALALGLVLAAAAAAAPPEGGAAAPEGAAAEREPAEASASPPGAAEPGCAPWPGEMRPLPTAGDADAARARYARLRAEALARWARLLEPRSRALAHALWRHAACLEPERSAWRDAARRTRPVRVHRPAVLRAAPERGRPLPAPAPSREAALASPLRVALPSPEPPGAEGEETGRGAAGEPEAEPLPPETARALERSRAALREARFEEALAQAERARARLAEAGGPGSARARAELLAATAELALGRRAAARESLARALRAEPGLRLAPDAHSPKVVELFEEVRARRGARVESSAAEGGAAGAGEASP